MINVMHLGNGGAFDTTMTNSSFIIDLDTGNNKEKKNKEYLLFDCGYNVFKALKSLPHIIENLKYVYISHMDDDHMGSLKTLIYYCYFVLNKKLIILADHHGIAEDLFKYLDDVNGEMIDGKYYKTNIFHKVALINSLGIGSDRKIHISCFKSNHISKPCSGLIIRETENRINDVLFITGDTTPDGFIIGNIDRFRDSSHNVYLFHDFSFWNEKNKQVHACKDSFLSKYSYLSETSTMYKMIANEKLYLYHTGKEHLTGFNSLSKLTTSNENRNAIKHGLFE